MTTLFASVEIGGNSRPVGRLDSTVRRGRVSSVFQYDADYFATSDGYSVEPALPLRGGAFAVGGELPRSFQDAAPDRWGRNLIAKRLRADTATAGGPARVLDERDYLLGVSDATRQGALRFRTARTGPFLAQDVDVPKLVSLPQLLAASEAVARDADDLAAIKVLLAAGTASLGGARPKASVMDGERLLIAKFPHPGDQWSVMRWEKTALDLADLAGVSVPTSTLVEVDGAAVLLLERFDRAGSDRRGYISAMTLLEAADGESRDYLEIAEAIPVHSDRPDHDLRELFRRVAFSIAVHNTDDHLRNHGFLRGRAGWELAPAFDVNPTPDPRVERATAVGGATSPAGEAAVLLDLSDTFGLTRTAAAGILGEVVDAARGWPAVAHANGVPPGELGLFDQTLNGSIDAVAAAR